ncbi:MAG TPA: site-2 protease family protein [Longimicrobiales bacterium]|nr:site-2 protease family protein [Longimicrobiales bacterium]
MDAILLIAVLICSVVVHEVAHAWQARREGDHTAEQLGRITLNPLPHLDPIGSVLVPLALHFSGSSFLFGWAKPVPVNPANYRDYVWGDVRVSLAGVVSNLGLAVLATLASVAVLKLEAGVGPLGGVTAALSQMARYGVVINVVLATFNLIPIPPLDGSHVLYHALPARLAVPYQRAGRYGLLVLMGLMFLAPSAFRILMWPVGALVGAADAFIRLWI